MCFRLRFIILDVQPSDEFLMIIVDLTALTMTSLTQRIHEKLGQRDYIKLEVLLAGGRHVLLDGDSLNIQKSGRSDTIRVLLMR